MKTKINARSGGHTANPPGQRAAGARPNATKTFEHRYERRKIRGQLRRQNWVLNAEDEILPDTLLRYPGRTGFRH